jgi:hypothetical protein
VVSGFRTVGVAAGVDFGQGVDVHAGVDLSGLHANVAESDEFPGNASRGRNTLVLVFRG